LLVNPVRVGVVEDHPVYREGLLTALEAAEDLTVAGAVGTVRDALALLAGTPMDVLLLDLGLPDGSGLDLLGTLRQRHPDVRTVVLTMNDEPALVLQAVRAGARGYLLKGASRVEIVDTVRRTGAGGAVFGPGSADVVVAAMSGGVSDPASQLGLTPREVDVLRLITIGLPNRSIAARLGIAPKTVRNQVSSVLTKLGADTRAAAAERGRAAGLGSSPR
jgi:DNA-binding NarL/FixJ family response regulator